MFIGTCYSELPICTSEEMTATFNGDVLEYEVFIDQELLKNISLKQKSAHDVYINTEKQYTATVEKQLEYDIHIEKQVDFTLEN